MTRQLFSADQPDEPVKGSLEDVLGREADDRLVQALDLMEERVRAVRAQGADTAADPELLAVVERVATRDGAPFEVRWLAGRVAAGDLDWADVWGSPAEHSGGTWLWAEVVREVTDAARDATLSHDLGRL
jgi:hypothetical protein